MMWVEGLRRDCWHKEAHVLSAAEECTEPQGGHFPALSTRLGADGLAG